MLALLSFLQLVFTFFGVGEPGNLMYEASMLLPKSLNSIRGVLRGRACMEYVVCPKCNALYRMEDCIIRRNGGEESQFCDFVEYPRHPQVSRRSKWNTPLLKRISVGQRTKLIPHKTF